MPPVLFLPLLPPLGTQAYNSSFSLVWLLFLYAQAHNSIHQIALTRAKCLNRLLPRYGCLCHDQLDILLLNASHVHLLSIVIVILLFGLLCICGVDGFALTVFTWCVVVACVGIGLRSINGCKLGSGVGLSLRVKIFDFGFAEDAEKGLVAAGGILGRNGSTYIQVLLDGDL